MKKAQATIYIILGLILVLSIALLTYVTEKKELTKEKPMQVPTEARPVHESITTCLMQMAKEAIVRLGLQGGYLELPREIARTPTAYLSLDPLNMLKLPYWYYEAQDRTPSLQDIENQITKYIKDNSNTCKTSFQQFLPAEVETLDEIKPKTILTQEDVTITAKWPIAIKLAGRTTTIEDFPLKLPVRLKKAWEFANSVMQTENRISFFENRTIDFMAANEKIPTDGMVFECGPKKWFIPEIKKELQQTLQYNIPYIRIQNTNHPRFAEKRSAYTELAKTREKMLKNLEKGISLDKQALPTNAPEDAYEYFKMTMDAGTAPTDLKATFTYQPEWGMLLTADPHDGQALKTNVGKGVKKYLPFLCINQWHFTYDIIYPVKLTIKDEKAFLNKGYIFQIAFPVIINSNAPERVFFGIQKFRQPAYLEEFCATRSNTIADIRVKGFIEDIPMATEMPDVNITYTCFNQYCELGTTKADDGYYRLRTPLPQGCNNPIITAAKEGYLEAKGYYRGEKLELTMTRLKKMNITFVLHSYNLQDKKYMDTTTQLQPNQKIALYIMLRNNTLDQYKTYPQDTQIELVEGKASYDINAILTSNDKITGGYAAEAFNITYTDIADKNTIVLHAIELKPHPITTKQQGEAAQFLHGNEEYKKTLKPEFR